MSRDLTPAAGAAFAASQVRLLIFVEMDFSTGFLRVNNSTVTVAWNGYDWLGAGRLGGIDPIKEGAGLEAYGLALRISGIDTAHISLALGTHYQGRACRVWVAPLTADHGVISDPVLTFSGRMDTMDIEIGATATITVTAESLLAAWDRPNARRYNHEDQQIDYPGDLGLEFVPQMVDKQIVWGA